MQKAGLVFPIMWDKFLYNHSDPDKMLQNQDYAPFLFVRG